MVDEDVLPFLEADGIHHSLALHALQPRLDHRPLGRIDHDRHARDIRLGSHQVQKSDHRRFRVQHALVHVHVDDLRPAGNLLAGDIERGRVVARLDQLAKLGRAGDVRPFADIHEQRICIDAQRLQPREPAFHRR